MEYGSDRYYQATGERAALRGGSWSDTSYAGVFGLNLTAAPLYAGVRIGFRAAR